MKFYKIFISFVVINILLGSSHKFNQPFIDVAESSNPSIVSIISEIDLENETTSNDPEMIQNPFYRIDPFDNDPDNKEFVKKSESIHVTKRQEN